MTDNTADTDKVIFNDNLRLWDIPRRMVMVVTKCYKMKDETEYDIEYAAMIDVKDNRYVLARFDKDGRCLSGTGRIGFTNANTEYWRHVREFDYTDHLLDEKSIDKLMERLRPTYRLPSDNPGVQKIFSKYPWLKNKRPRTDNNLRIGDRVAVIKTYSGCGLNSEKYRGKVGKIDQVYGQFLTEPVYLVKFQEQHSLLELDDLLFLREHLLPIE